MVTNFQDGGNGDNTEQKKMNVFSRKEVLSCLIWVLLEQILEFSLWMFRTVRRTLQGNKFLTFSNVSEIGLKPVARLTIVFGTKFSQLTPGITCLFLALFSKRLQPNGAKLHWWKLTFSLHFEASISFPLGFAQKTYTIFGDALLAFSRFLFPLFLRNTCRPSTTYRETFQWIPKCKWCNRITHEM